jgi:small subunit ribosomal protein S21
MTQVYVFNGNLDQAIRILKRKMIKDGVLNEAKKRRVALSRGEKRRAKARNAKLRLKKSERQGVGKG